MKSGVYLNLMHLLLPHGALSSELKAAIMKGGLRLSPFLLKEKL